MARRDRVAFCVFATWTVLGLFVDGWAHQAEKPESFFTPWHGLLYSGFLAALGTATIATWRDRYLGREPQPVAHGARLSALGALLFLVGGVSDMLWHLSFGIEVDSEALLSPTHLVLAAGGVLAATAPFRAAWATDRDSRPGWRDFGPTLLSLTLTIAIVAFFTMFLSAFLLEDLHVTWEPDGVPDLLMMLGVASVLVSNLLVTGAVVLVLRRWHPPVGAFTAMATALAALQQALVGFDDAERLLPAFLGGLAADLVVRATGAGPSAPGGARLAAVALPAVTWPAFFAVAALTSGLGWSAELWSGTVVLACATALGLHALGQPVVLPED